MYTDPHYGGSSNFLAIFRHQGTPKQLEFVLDIVGNDFTVVVEKGPDGNEGPYETTLAKALFYRGEIGLLEVLEQRGLNFDDPQLLIEGVQSRDYRSQAFAISRYTGEITAEIAFAAVQSPEFNSWNAERLLKNADVANMRTAEGDTLLHFVKDVHLAKTLIANGADVNAPNNNGVTAFANMVESWHVSLIQAATKNSTPDVTHPSVLQAVRKRAERNYTKQGIEEIKDLFDQLNIDAPLVRGQAVARAIRGFERSAIGTSSEYKPVPML